MNPDSKIYVAGHRGLAGSAIVRRLRAKGYRNIVTRTHTELDLLDQRAVNDFFEKEHLEIVFLAAAKVGGILANNTYPADFIYQNLSIECNVIHEAYKAGVKRLLFLGSSCIYPRDCPQPMKESDLMTGPLEPTNRPYAVAKIAGIEMCWSYNRQYGTRYLCAMPTNLYGPGDNYDLQKSHVLPALIRKFHEAKVTGQRSVVVWGTGTPRRELLYSDDMADACIHLLELPQDRLASELDADQPPLVNVGFGEDLTIGELAECTREVVGTRADIQYDRSKPDGMPLKLLDSGLLNRLGWKSSIPLKRGIALAYQCFLEEQGAVRAL